MILFIYFWHRTCENTSRCCSSYISKKDEWIKGDLVSSTPVDWSDHQALLRSSAIIRNFERRKQYPEFSSPTSCLKPIGSSRSKVENASLTLRVTISNCTVGKKHLEKRVNFYDEQFPRQESPLSFSNSSSYYEPPHYNLLNKSSAATMKNSCKPESNWKRSSLSSSDGLLRRSFPCRRSVPVGKRIANESRIEAIKNTKKPSEYQSSITGEYSLRNGLSFTIMTAVFNRVFF
jgi:hypothetical protein